MLSINDKIEGGTLKLQSFSKPPLATGAYTANATLLIKAAQEELKNGIIAPVPPLRFTVKGPRFTLDDALVYSEYPAPGATGAYHTTLPHIVLTRKTLPWETKIDMNADVQTSKPWLALLVVNADEIKEYNVAVSEIPLKAINDNGGNMTLAVPNIEIHDWEIRDGTCNDVNQEAVQKAKVLELPISLFKKIAPLWDELELLVHTRQVDMGNKATTDVNPKGWFSVILSNRLPTTGQANTVYLVSLEGHRTTLTSSTLQTAIRLVVLRHWSFTEQGATFGELVEELNKNAGPLRIEINSADPKIPASIRKAFCYGYVPINHERKNGKKSVSWYRGPLVPLSSGSTKAYSYNNADQALRYDADTGMFDISYAAAWQLGRLMALQTPGFFKVISNWKNDYLRGRPVAIAEKKVSISAAAQDDKDNTKINAVDLDAVAAIASDEVFTDYLLELWAQLMTGSNAKR
jgi:hypothetical protein